MKDVTKIVSTERLLLKTAGRLCNAIYHDPPPPLCVTVNPYTAPPSNVFTTFPHSNARKHIIPFQCKKTLYPIPVQEKHYIPFQCKKTLSPIPMQENTFSHSSARKTLYPIPMQEKHFIPFQCKKTLYPNPMQKNHFLPFQCKKNDAVNSVHQVPIMFRVWSLVKCHMTWQSARSKVRMNSRLKHERVA